MFKIGDRVRLKGDTGWGTISWIGGGYKQLCLDIEYPLESLYRNCPVDKVAEFYRSLKAQTMIMF